MKFLRNEQGATLLEAVFAISIFSIIGLFAMPCVDSAFNVQQLVQAKADGDLAAGQTRIYFERNPDATVKYVSQGCDNPTNPAEEPLSPFLSTTPSTCLLVSGTQNRWKVEAFVKGHLDKQAYYGEFGVDTLTQ